jgi:hypothetical protein
MVRGEELKVIESLPDAETVEETSASRHAALPLLQPRLVNCQTSWRDVIGMCPPADKLTNNLIFASQVVTIMCVGIETQP